MSLVSASVRGGIPRIGSPGKTQRERLIQREKKTQRERLIQREKKTEAVDR